MQKIVRFRSLCHLKPTSNFITWKRRAFNFKDVLSHCVFGAALSEVNNDSFHFCWGIPVGMANILSTILSLFVFVSFFNKGLNKSREGWMRCLPYIIDLIFSCREVRKLNPYHTYLVQISNRFWRQMKTTLFCFLLFFLFVGNLNLTVSHKGIFPFSIIWFFWNNWL